MLCYLWEKYGTVGNKKGEFSLQVYLSSSTLKDTLMYFS